MKRMSVLLLLLILAGCGGRVTVPAGSGQITSPPPAPEPPPVAVAEPAPAPAPALRGSRDEIQTGLTRYMNEGDEPAAQKVARLRQEYRDDAVPFLEADLDGDGQQEYAIALPVLEQDQSYERGGALFVIYRKEGRWAVDYTDPLDTEMEHLLMPPHLHAALDLAGRGRPQIAWSRPFTIATGPQPFAVFVTEWKPGSFTDLPGEMMISNMTIGAEGKDLVLKGVSRGALFIRNQPLRVDRYRFVDGRFRLVDRRFLVESEFGYDQFWDGLVAENVGRLEDALQDYRTAAAPATIPHSGSYPQYNSRPAELTPEQMESFGQALRAFARFRAGALLVGANRRTEAQEWLKPGGGPYEGLTEAMRTAPNREAGCQAATLWAQAYPAFLEAFNQGFSHPKWEPAILCTHIPLGG